MTEKNETTTTEPTFEQEVEAFLNMDPEESHRQTQRRLAEAIVRHDRKKRGIVDDAG
jgi:hypothetical protein